MLGDFYRDDHVDASDILAMEQALANLPAYETAKGLTNAQFLAIGDINGDGKITDADLQSLLNYLHNGGGSNAAVPEPTSLLLLLLSGAAMTLVRGSIACRKWWRAILPEA